MELMEAINTRRSVRRYTPAPVDKAVIEQLLNAAVQAPNAMNAQPWAFGVIRGVEALRGYSARAKAHLLTLMGPDSPLAGYREHLENPAFNIFYDAPALVLIYAKPGAFKGDRDCCLAAQTLMLAARGMGLGTCWIGFSEPFFNLPETRAELGVPADYTTIAPLFVGHPEGETPPVPRNAPEVVLWREA